MYFETIPLSVKKPNGGFFRRRVALVNLKSKNITTMTPGMVTDWDYYMDKGFTHWMKPISNKKLKQTLCTKSKILSYDEQ